MHVHTDARTSPVDRAGCDDTEPSFGRRYTEQPKLGDFPFSDERGEFSFPQRVRSFIAAC